MDFQQKILAGRKLWEKFPGILRGFVSISEREYWRQETVGDFFKKCGEGLRGCPKSNVGGKKLWGNPCRNLEKGLRGFPKSNVCGKALHRIFF